MVKYILKIMGKAKQTFQTYLRLFLIVFAVVAPMLIIASVSAAPTYTSPNYGVDEVFMGAGGLNDASSANYKARASLGDLAVGNTSSTNYQAYGGFTTNTDPYIEFVVDGGNIDLGYLSDTETKFTSTKFRIRTYLAEGYSIHTISGPPLLYDKPGEHTLSVNNNPTASTIGTEQFGINLVDNSTPNIGGDPTQLPDATFSYGQVDDDYDNPNQYMYIKDDRVAYSNKSSGITEFTVSYIFNIDGLTPAGTYYFHHILVATSVY
jgi:hypothetical protein